MHPPYPCTAFLPAINGGVFCGSFINKKLLNSNLMCGSNIGDRPHALKRVFKADIIDVNNWPKKGGLSIYSGFTFAVNDSTKKQIGKYTKFRERQKRDEAVV